jgi:hypothetical protein
MSLEEAKAFCQQQGGKLPRIGNSASWDGNNPPGANIPIDAFGAQGAHWPSGLPNNYYWSGTDYTASPGYSWFIVGLGGLVYVSFDVQGYANGVVCVP